LLDLKRSKERFVRLNCDRPFFRIAMIGAIAASLGLTACGRKGPLDPPPSATLSGNKVPNNINSKPALDKHGRPQAPPGPNQQIPLDALLN
jgi:predicted small lipoprotein YifL